MAIEAIELATYRGVDIRYTGNKASVDLTYRGVDIRYTGNKASVDLKTGDGWEAGETFASGRDLAAGLTRLGLERIMLREHRSMEDFIYAADAKLAAPDAGGTRP